MNENVIKQLADRVMNQVEPKGKSKEQYYAEIKDRIKYIAFDQDQYELFIKYITEKMKW